MTEQHHQLALALIPGIGAVWLKKLLAHFGSAQAVFSAAHSNNGLMPKNIAQQITINSSLAQNQAEKIRTIHEAEGIQLLTMGVAHFPKRLLELPDGPAILYYKGQALLNTQRVVSMVGTRELTPYGQRAITKFLEQLLPYQPLVVSGLAYGTDVWAHQTALAVGLTTVAVLPTSLTNLYPKAHTKIAEKIVEAGGGLLTEYPIGDTLQKYAFVARNRIVAGIADVTIVIEAKEKSGALITAYYANGYHREVFALPGSIDTLTAAGCHQLIKRNQAHLLTHINDLAYIMNWDPHEVQKKTLCLRHPLTPPEQLILAQFRKTIEPIAIDHLATATNLSLGELHSALLSLELQGLLRVLPGKRFSLMHKPID